MRSVVLAIENRLRSSSTRISSTHERRKSSSRLDRIVTKISFAVGIAGFQRSQEGRALQNTSHADQLGYHDDFDVAGSQRRSDCTGIRLPRTLAAPLNRNASGTARIRSARILTLCVIAGARYSCSAGRNVAFGRNHTGTIAISSSRKGMPIA